MSCDKKSSAAAFSHSCLNCSSTQSSPTHAGHYRNRRSNSCPGDNRSFLNHFDAYSQKSNMTGIQKRWHSIPAVYVNRSDFQAHTEHESNNTSKLWSSNSKDLIGSYSSNTTSSLAQRVASLFTLGALLALILNLLQKQKGVTVFSPGIFGDVLNSAWWIPPTFGLAAIVIGLLYPKLDQLVGNQKKLNQEWSSVMRCIALFVGINHASARIVFESNGHLLLTLAVLSLGLWYFFDHSISGLGLGLAIAGVATVATQVLVAMDVFGYTNPDFIYMQSWVPCLYFSGGVTIGAFGRALAAFEDGGCLHYRME